MLNQIQSDLAPKALGPYSQAVQSNNLIFCSGQLGLDPKTNELVSEKTEDQAEQALENLQEVLKATNCGMANVVRCDIFLTDLNDFSAVNKVYGEFFNTDPKPARQTVQISGLPKNAKVEISCIAVKEN